MHEELSEALLEDGFAKFEGLFSKAEIGAWRRVAQDALNELDAEHRERFRSNGSLCNLAELPAFAPLIGDPRITDAIASLGGDDIRWTSGYLISKPAGGDPLFWHQDWWGWGEAVSYDAFPAQLFVMIYLTDTRVENGCLRVIPGSHRRDHELHNLPAAHTKDIATGIDLNSPVYASHPDELAATVSAGDVLIGDARLLHSAYANRTDEERPLLTLWYIPNWSAMPGSVRATLRAIYDRQVVDIDEGAGNLTTPDHWPGEARKKIEHLLPHYEGDDEPTAWNRLPDRERLLSAKGQA